MGVYLGLGYVQLDRSERNVACRARCQSLGSGLLHAGLFHILLAFTNTVLIITFSGWNLGLLLAGQLLLPMRAL